ncbi:MAG TPA: hypothetical protein VJ863_08280 [Sphaerochaeta sp.]|nr:hypothetical protein [Sphaerochaeta sp.]
MNIKCNTKRAVSHVSEEDLQTYLLGNKSLIESVQAGLEQDKASLGWFTVPQECSPELQALAAKVQNMAEVMIVIGIGGSNRAAIAALDALRRTADSPTTLYFAGDSLSTARLQDALHLVRTKSVVLNVIAKDFNTVEPGIWFRMLRSAMKEKYGPRYNERVVAIGSEGPGQLYELSKLHRYAYLPFPKDIGGRFSALSPVGLFPMAVAGLDVEKILDGAREQEKRCKEAPYNENSAVRYASLRNIIRKRGIQVESLVFFEPDLLALSRWWIQLFAESEGKTDIVLFPVGFSYSEDLHAVGQYVQEGPRVILETFLHVNYQTEELQIEPSEDVEDGFSYLDGKPFSALNESVYRSSLKAHSDDGVPCCELTTDSPLNEQSLGSLFWFFLFSAYLSATMLGVVPFDQDGVESYKKNMYAELGKKGAK